MTRPVLLSGLLAILTCAGLYLFFSRANGGSTGVLFHPGPYVNSVGVQLPPDAAPPEYQTITTFEMDNGYMDESVSSYQKVFGFALVNEPLLRVDRNFNLQPAAATHWEMSEDGLTWVFHLQVDLIFSDGHPLTAYDYESTIRRHVDPKTGYDFEWYYRPIKNWGEVIEGRLPIDSVGVRALDAYTLAITTEQPVPYLPAMFSFTWVTAQHAFEKYGPAWSTRPETLVASGPYRLREWRKGDRIVLEPNPYYRGPNKPFLERIVAMLYSTAAQPPFLPAYEGGEVDYIVLNNQAEINRVRNDPELRKQLNSYIDFATYYLTMDTYHAPFNDLRVRQAFAHAIDREALTKSALRDIGLPALSMLQPGFPGADPDRLSGIQRFDLNLARQRLAEAGYPDGRGFPTMDLWVRSDLGKPIVDGAEAIQAMLMQNLNIQIGVRVIEKKIYLEALNTHAMTLGLATYRYDYVDPSNLMALWLSNGRHAWRHERFEQLVQQAHVLTRDPERRIELYQEAERILVSDVGGVFLWYILASELWKPYVRGEAIEPDRTGRRAWRGDQMVNLSPTLYISKEGMRRNVTTDFAAIRFRE